MEKKSSGFHPNSIPPRLKRGEFGGLKEKNKEPNLNLRTPLLIYDMMPTNFLSMDFLKTDTEKEKVFAFLVFVLNWKEKKKTFSDGTLPLQMLNKLAGLKNIRFLKVMTNFGSEPKRPSKNIPFSCFPILGLRVLELSLSTLE